MSIKRPPSPALIQNPFIKKRNLEWTLEPAEQPSEAEARSLTSNQEAPQTASTAAIESGAIKVDDHLTHFTTYLSSHTLPSPQTPLLPVPQYASLYTSNAGSLHGAHFVIHQHDHPIAGTHYDLRLQINESSSVSWAVMYGLPGDPNSVRLNRNATETRIHCLWNHLIETASPETGSLLIWDTGTYTVLPRQSKHAPIEDASSQPSPEHSPSASVTQQELLHAAFQNRKIRLRLHGSKMPDPYVVNIRLTKSEDAIGRAKSLRSAKSKRRRRRGKLGGKQEQVETSSDEDRHREGSSDSEHHVADGEDDVVPRMTEKVDGAEQVSAMDRELRELEDEQVRLTNAYPGANNSIGSVHQRKWYLSLDRAACEFIKTRSTTPSGKGRRAETWALPEDDEKENGNEEEGEGEKKLRYPFYVRGAQYEKSVVTGRTGADVLRDEGVDGFVQRKGWTPVLN